MKSSRRALFALLAVCVVLTASAASFAPNLGNATVALTVTGTSATAQIPSAFQGQYVLTNMGTNVIYVEFGAPGATPVATTTTSMPMLPNSQFLVSGPTNAVVAAISGATGNTLYITPGQGS